MKSSLRQSNLFSKTRKEAPKDEVSKNAQLLIRAGFIHKDMAGVYSFMPLGLRTLSKIEQIIREEMNAIGGQEIELNALQEKNVWEKTGRWDDEIVDVWFKTKLKNDTELGLAYTHEPIVTEIMKEYISSYRDLPLYPYQFQKKFRNELRAKSGLFRGREFLMKDMYSFSESQEELDAFYEKAIQAYKKSFERIGLGDRTYLTLASGGSFGTKYSHEFQTLTSAGEDIIYIHKEKNIAINKEVMTEEALSMLGIKREELVEDKSVEVGNIYKLGTFYSEPLELRFKNDQGESKPVIMGSYGMGVPRIMGTVVETLSDEKGLVWPMNVAPYEIHLIEIPNEKNPEVKKMTEKIFAELSKKFEVLYDDRDARAGEKFGEADLIGLPYQIIVSERSLKENSIEIKKRADQSAQLIKIEDISSIHFQ